MNADPDAWDLALRALDVLAVDPPGLGGLWLRARPGPARDAFLARATERLNPLRIHPSMAPEALFGGTDLVASLAGGGRIDRSGLVGGGRVLVLAMAERCERPLAARLAQAIDAGAATIIAVDEGEGPDEGLPPALAERLGLFAALDGVRVAGRGRAVAPPLPGPAAQLASDGLPTLARIAAELGIGSLRAPLMAGRAARALARLDGRTTVSQDDIAEAAGLVFAHRAAEPAEEASEAPSEPTEPPAESEREDSGTEKETSALPDELIVEAVRGHLPPDLVAGLPKPGGRGFGGAGAGAPVKGNRRGRPLPPRAGRSGTGARIDVVATLAAAAPWQRLRTRTDARPVAILPGDLRYSRFEARSDRLLVFAVDASGSAAMARLAEAKGAIELLLADAYASRDHVALVAFRGAGADVLLEPTRSLSRAKRTLGALPGGGGTPLAAGLERAFEICRTARGRGFDARIVLLTDGRANVARDGQTGRGPALSDAAAMARPIRAAGIGGVVLDAGRRPSTDLQALAATLAMPCHFLPRADAAQVSRIAATALADRG